MIRDINLRRINLEMIMIEIITKEAWVIRDSAENNPEVHQFLGKIFKR